MPSPSHVRLFIKPWCGWCRSATAWLDAHGVKYEVLDIEADSAARQLMFDLTEKPSVPSLEADGKIIADFDTDQLERWWTAAGFELPERR